MLWRSAVFLTLLLGEALAAPFPGSYSLPAIPFGRRIQYYILKNDGSYKEGYDTGTGQYQSAVASDTNQVDGQYGFKNPEGKDIKVRYKSGIQGFVPEAYGIVIPKTAIPENQEEFVDPLANPNEDGTYSFSYKASDHGRSESSDSEGNILGEYHYYAEDGNRYRYRYRAGAGQGFVVDVDLEAGAPRSKPKEASLPKQPAVPVLPARNFPTTQVQSLPQSQDQEEFVDPLADPNVDGTYSFSYNADDHGRQESSDSEGNILGEYHFYTEDGGHYKLRYNAGADKGFVVDIDQTAGTPVAKEPSAPVIPPRPAVPTNILPGIRSSVVPQVDTEPRQPDEDTDVPSSYSFSYNTGDQTHTQFSDSSGKVSGNFAFVADDGVRRRVDYTASAESGFEASGEHLPKAQKDTIADVQSFEPQRKDAPVVPKSPIQPSAPLSPTPTDTEDDGADKSYSFSYHAGDSARTEISDKEGTITGFFTFLDDNNEQKTVVYNAGKFIGFLADGEHLPVRANIPLPKFAIPSLYPVDRKTANLKAAPEVSDVKATINPDGSYTFSFVTSDQSRTETGSSDGKVTGSFTFVATGGEKFSTDYEANSETGFVAKGKHIPDPPAVPLVPAVPIVEKSPKTSIGQAKPSVPVVPVHLLPTPQVVLPVVPVQQKRPVLVSVPAKSSPVVPVTTSSHVKGSYKFGERIQLPEGLLEQWLAGTSPEEYGYIYREQ